MRILPDENANAEQRISQLNELALLAEKVARYEDMSFYMQEIVKSTGGKLIEEQRNHLSVAFKNVVGQLRSSYRNLKDHRKSFDQELKDTQNESDRNKISDNIKKLEIYIGLIKDEVVSKCEEVVKLLTDGAGKGGVEIPDKNTEDKGAAEQAVFYLKMKGDYYRYMAEVAGGDYGNSACVAYDEADERAQELGETHPTRLGLALNRSVCYFEIENKKQKAIDVAKEAFDCAIQKLDTLNDDTYKDSTLIMQLLRDNLTLWNSENNEVEPLED